MIIDTVVLCILILVLLTLSVIQGHRSARKFLKSMRQLSHKVFNRYERMEFGMLLRLVAVMSPISFYFVQLIFMGEKPTYSYMVLLEKKITLASILTFTN